MSYLQSSFPEQAIFYYIKQFYNDTLSRYKINNYEIDIFIPSLNIGIEYDGSYWHREKVDIDNKKNSIFNKNNIYIIRIREYNLPELSEFNGIILNCPKDYNQDEFFKMVYNILYILSNFEKDYELKKRLLEFKITNYKEDVVNIYGLLYNRPLSENLMGSCGIEFWNYDLNGLLNPINLNFSKNISNFAMFVKCKNGNDIYTSRDMWLTQKNNCDKNCKKCINNICPLLLFCSLECKIFNNYIMSIFESRYKIDIKYISRLFKTQLIKDMIIRRIDSKDELFNKKFDSNFFILIKSRNVKYYICKGKFEFVKSKEDLLLLEKLALIYEGYFYKERNIPELLFDARNLDNNTEDRKALIKYIENRINMPYDLRYGIIFDIFMEGLCSYNHCISIYLFNMLVDLLNKYKQMLSDDIKIFELIKTYKNRQHID